MSEAPQKTQETYTSAVQRALEKHKVRKGCTYEFIAEEADVAPNTVKQWRGGESAPQGANLFALTRLFGTEFLNDVLVPFGYAGVYKISGEASSPEQIHTEIARLNQVITEMREDGRIDHRERAQIKKELTLLVSQAVQFIAEAA